MKPQIGYFRPCDDDDDDYCDDGDEEYSPSVSRYGSPWETQWRWYLRDGKLSENEIEKLIDFYVKYPNRWKEKPD